MNLTETILKLKAGDFIEVDLDSGETVKAEVVRIQPRAIGVPAIFASVGLRRPVQVVLGVNNRWGVYGQH